MTFIELRDALVKLGEASARKTETRPEKLQGCLDGFAILKRMNNIDELESEVNAREPELRNLVDAVRADETKAPEYWKFRCATAQLEWAFEIFQVGYPNRYAVTSVRATMMYAKIVGVNGDKLE